MANYYIYEYLVHFFLNRSFTESKRPQDED